MKKRRGLAIVLAMLMLLAPVLGLLTTVSADDPQVFRVGMEVNYAPFNWSQTTDADGAVPVSNSPGEFANGYDVQIAKRLAEKLGRKLEIVKTEWDGLAPSVMSGKLDAIIAGMSPTAERRQQIDFSDKYYTSDLVIVVKKDGPYANAKSLKDFAGARITGQLNTFHYSVIDQIPDVKKQTAMEDFPAMITALNAGKIDGYVSERPGAMAATATNSDLAYVAFEGDNGFKADPDDTSIAVGLKKGSPLTAEINQALADIPESDRQKLMGDMVKLQAGETEAAEAAADADKEPLRVGMEVNYAPFNWAQTTDANGALPVSNSQGEYANGYDVQIAKLIAAKINRRVEIVKTEWDGLAPSVMAGKLDCIIAGMSPTAERREQIDFSDKYYTSDLVIVVKKDGPYAEALSLDDFKGARITGQLNTFHYGVIDQIPEVKKQTAMEDFPAMITALKAGKIDGYVSERPGAMAAAESNSDLTFVSFAEGKGFKADPNDTSIAVGLKKGSPLTSEINDALKTISEDERQELMEKMVRLQAGHTDEESDINYEKKGGEFVVGMEVNYAPFNWSQKYDTNGAVAVANSQGEFANGYDVQIAKKIADGLGKKLVIVKTKWDGLAPAVMSGKIDAIIAGMSPTPERRAQIDFTDKYYTSDLVMVVKKGGKYSNAKTLDDFAGARVTGQLNTFHYTVIDQIKGVHKEQAMEDFPAMISALKAGKIDAYVSERPGALSAQASNPDLECIAFEPGKGFKTNEDDTSIAVGLKKGSDLREPINEILKKISEKDRQDLMEQMVELQTKKNDLTFWQSVGYLIKEYGSLFLRGAGVTLLISIVSTVIGFIIGLVVSMIKTVPKSKNKATRYVQNAVNFILNVYIEIFRGTPMIVQALLIFYGAAMFFGIDMKSLTAAFIVVSVNTGAYLSEVVRSGINAIDKGQFEGAKAIGMTHRQTMMYVVLPQAIKNILPAIGNEFVINIKDTAVLNVIQVTELFFTSSSVQGSTYMIFQTYFITCVIYFVMTFTVTRIIRLIEKKMAGDASYQLVKGDMLDEQE